MFPIRYYYKIFSKGDIIFTTFACAFTFLILWVIGLFYTMDPNLYMPILGIIGWIVLTVRVAYHVFSPIALEMLNNQMCLYHCFIRKQTIEFSDLVGISLYFTRKYNLAYIGLIIRNGQEHKYRSRLKWGIDATGSTIKFIKIPVYMFKGQPQTIYEELRKVSGLPEDNTRANTINAYRDMVNKKLSSTEW